MEYIDAREFFVHQENTSYAEPDLQSGSKHLKYCTKLKNGTTMNIQRCTNIYLYPGIKYCEPIFKIDPACGDV